MKQKKIISLVLLLVVLSTLYYFTKDFNFDAFLEKPITPKIDAYVADSGGIQLYFCPREDCEGALVAFLNSAQESIHCALFEIDLKSVQDKLLEKSQVMEVKIITDDSYLDEFNHSFVKADRSG